MRKHACFQFQPGDSVALACCPQFPGVVTGHARGRVLVRFDDLDSIERPFLPTALVRVALPDVRTP